MSRFVTLNRKLKKKIPVYIINNNNSSATESFPTGFRFVPKDYELIMSYLLPKITGDTFPPDIVIEIDNLYQYHPDNLPDDEFKHGSLINAAYFFTRMNHTGTKTRGGGGSWKAIGNEEEVVHQKKVVGFKKTLLYDNPSETEPNSWVMHQFRLNPECYPLEDKSITTKMASYVVCMIKDE